MTDEQAALVMDEAGKTAENLLDGDQPMLALGALHMPREQAQVFVDAATKRQSGRHRETPGGVG